MDPPFGVRNPTVLALTGVATVGFGVAAEPLLRVAELSAMLAG